MAVWLSLPCCMAEISTTSQIYFNKKFKIKKKETAHIVEIVLGSCRRERGQRCTQEGLVKQREPCISCIPHHQQVLGWFC